MTLEASIDRVATNDKTLTTLDLESNDLNNEVSKITKGLTTAKAAIKHSTASGSLY